MLGIRGVAALIGCVAPLLQASGALVLSPDRLTVYDTVNAPRAYNPASTPTDR
jgi:hypothetical protein